jgi:hypothetical protein
VLADQTTVLQLVLNELGGADISTQDDRIAIQKLICLVQEAGLQLGYSFNWYVRGPYSPGLTSDYYQIASKRDAVEADAQNYALSEPAREAVQRVANVATPPPQANLPKVLWLELVASIAFLVRRYRLSKEAAEAKIRSSKPYLAPHFNVGYQALSGAGFLE